MWQTRKQEKSTKKLWNLPKSSAKKTGVTYPVLIPDAALSDGLLNGIPGYPKTFFIGKDGNVVADSLLGAQDKESWKQTIEDILSKIKE